MAHETDPEDTATEFVGIPVTPEGKARARARRLAVNRRRTPERLAAMRAKIGMPATPVTNG
jgi:hypothetical protein